MAHKQDHLLQEASVPAMEEGAYIEVQRGNGPDQLGVVVSVGPRAVQCRFMDRRVAWVEFSLVRLVPSDQIQEEVAEVLRRSPPVMPKRRSESFGRSNWAISSLCVLVFLIAGAGIWLGLGDVQNEDEGTDDVRSVRDLVQADVARIQLPGGATNARPFEEHSSLAEIVVDAQGVSLNGEFVEDCYPITRDRRMRRLEGLTQELKALRRGWEQAHPKEQHPGRVRIWVDRAVSAMVLKSVFQTAGFAGYPSFDFVVRSQSGDLSRLPAHANIPGRRVP